MLAKLARLSEAVFDSGNAQEVEMKKQLVSIVSCLGLVSAGVVGVSAPSSAAVGETKIFTAASILGNGSKIFEVAASRGGQIHGVGRNGAGQDAYFVLNSSGAVLRSGALDIDPGDVSGVAATPNGTTYICGDSLLGLVRIDPQGNQTTVPLPGICDSPTLGGDGAVWYFLDRRNNPERDGLGRVTASGETSRIEPNIVPSNVNDDILGRSLARGSSTIPIYVTMVSSPIGGPPFNVVSGSWVGSVRANARTADLIPVKFRSFGGLIPAEFGFKTLAVSAGKVISGDSERPGAYEMTLNGPEITAGYRNASDGIVPVPKFTSGADETFWMAEAVAGTKVTHYDQNFTALGTYNFPVGTFRDFTTDASGDLWIALSEDGLARMSGGAIPVVQQAPELSQPTGAAAGSAVTVSGGTWTNNPGSYTYQWQECSQADGSDCTDIPGATGASYTPTDAQAGKYVRAGVTAVNTSGGSQQTFTSLIPVTAAGTTPPTTPPGTPQAPTTGTPVATGTVASIGAEAVMELDIPAKTRQGKRKFYEAFFTKSDVAGVVQFTFKRKKRSKTVVVPIEDGIAEYRWKTPKRWPRGKTRVIATYIPAAGSVYETAATKDRVKVRKRR